MPKILFISVHLQLSVFKKCRTKLLEENYNYPAFKLKTLVIDNKSKLNADISYCLCHKNLGWYQENAHQ